MSQEGDKELHYMVGKKNEEVLELLARSLVCTTEDPRVLYLDFSPQQVQIHYHLPISPAIRRST